MLPRRLCLAGLSNGGGMVKERRLPSCTMVMVGRRRLATEQPGSSNNTEKKAGDGRVRGRNHQSETPAPVELSPRNVFLHMKRNKQVVQAVVDDLTPPPPYVPGSLPNPVITVPHNPAFKVGDVLNINPQAVKEELPRVMARTHCAAVWWPSLSKSSFSSSPTTPSDPTTSTTEKKQGHPNPLRRAIEANTIPEEHRKFMIRDSLVSLLDKLKHLADTKTSTSELLVGRRGTGKSVMLYQCVQWARQNGWIVLYVPNAADFVTARGALRVGTMTGAGFTLSPLQPGMYGQPVGAMSLLSSLLDAHGKDLMSLPQRRTYTHTLYKAREGLSSLAHIAARGSNSPGHAADAFYDLRMELSLVEERPVLVAVDEINALYWPTGLWHSGNPIHASSLLVPKALRFVAGGDTGVRCSIMAGHQPKRGAVIGAVTNSLAPPPHPTIYPPRHLQTIPGNEPFKRHIPPYSTQELKSIWEFYAKQGLLAEREQDAIYGMDLDRVTAITDAVGELVFKEAIQRLAV